MCLNLEFLRDEILNEILAQCQHFISAVLLETKNFSDWPPEQAAVKLKNSLTLKGPYVAMPGQRVPLQMKRSLEGHATLLTRLVLRGVMQTRMSRQILACLERVSALLTLKQPQVMRVMRSQMVLQRVPRVETALTS